MNPVLLYSLIAMTVSIVWLFSCFCFMDYFPGPDWLEWLFDNPGIPAFFTILSIMAVLIGAGIQLAHGISINIKVGG